MTLRRLLFLLFPSGSILLSALIVTLIAGALPGGEQLVLLPAAVLFPVALRLHCLAERKENIFYLFSLLATAFGTAVASSAYYVAIGATPAIGQMLLCALPCAVLPLLCLGAIAVMPRRVRSMVTICILLTIALIVVGMVFWIRTRTGIFPSFLCLSAITLLPFFVAVPYVLDDVASPALRYASFAGFGALTFVAIAVVAAIAFAQGDCGDCSCDACDCTGGTDGKQSKKKAG